MTPGTADVKRGCMEGPNAVGVSKDGSQDRFACSAT